MSERQESNSSFDSKIDNVLRENHKDPLQQFDEKKSVDIRIYFKSEQLNEIFFIDVL